MLTRSWPRKMFGFVWKSCRPKLAALGSSSTKCHSCFPFRRDRPLKSSCLPRTWWLTASLKLTGRQCGCRSLAIAQSQALARHFCKYYQRNRVKLMWENTYTTSGFSRLYGGKILSLSLNGIWEPLCDPGFYESSYSSWLFIKYETT